MLRSSEHSRAMVIIKPTATVVTCPRPVSEQASQHFCTDKSAHEAPPTGEKLFASNGLRGDVAAAVLPMFWGGGSTPISPVSMWTLIGLSGL